MNTKAAIFRSVFVVLICLACGFVRLPTVRSEQVAHGAAPTETIALSSGTPAATLTLTLVKVLPGSVTLGDPDGEPREENLTLAYSIMTAEMSLAQFQSLAPEQALHQRQERVEAIAVTIEQKRILEEISRRGDTYAAQVVTVDDVAMLTARLNSLYAPQQETNRLLVTRRFRLPTAWEWQHAMSLGSQQSSRDINPWPNYQTDFSEKEQTFLQTKWQAAGGQGQFQGTREQVRALLKRCPNPEFGIVVLNLFFRDLLCGRSASSGSNQRENGSWSEPPADLAETLTAGGKNAWGMFGAHRGYPEWTLAGSLGQQEALATWRRFEDGTATATDKGKPLFQLAGGHGICIDDTDLSPLSALFIWHERETSDGKSLFTVEEAEEKAVDFSATLRLVLVECLRDDWRMVVRQSFMSQAGAEQPQADRFTAELSQFSAQAKSDEAYVHAYCALAEYQHNNFTGSAERLSASASAVAETKAKGLSRDEVLGSGDGSASTQQQRPSSNTVYLRALAKLAGRDAGEETD